MKTDTFSLSGSGKTDLFAGPEAGNVRLEGKDYIVQHGDIIEFHFNE